MRSTRDRDALSLHRRRPIGKRLQGQAWRLTIQTQQAADGVSQCHGQQCSTAPKDGTVSRAVVSAKADAASLMNMSRVLRMTYSADSIG